MNQDIVRTSSFANEMVGASFVAGAVAALLTLGLANGVGRLVAWIGRQRLASNAQKHCDELEQFVKEMTVSFERLAWDLNSREPGLTFPLAAGLDGLRERSMWFFEDNYKAFVLSARRARPEEIRNNIGAWVVEPLRAALDAARRGVGRRLHQDQRRADRSQLNECIRGTEYELVAAASRLLRIDVARPGERTRSSRKWMRTLFLCGFLVSALPMRCATGWRAADSTASRQEAPAAQRHGKPSQQARPVAPRALRASRRTLQSHRPFQE